MAIRKSRRSRLEENKRRIRKMKIDYNRYVKDFYLEDGIAVISCNVSDYYDIIDRYSVEGYEWLNEHFARFIESNAFYIPVEYPIVLEICGMKFSRRQRSAIVETIQDYYQLKLGDKQMELNNITWRIIAFFVIAVVFTVIFFFVNRMASDNFFNEFIVILVWFFIWELSDLIIYDGKNLREEKMEAAQLASIVVRFEKEFVDEPYDEKETEQIYEALSEEKE